MASNRDFVVDTSQLENLGSELAVLPGDILAAIRSSLATSVNDTLKKVIPTVYKLDTKTLRKTYSVYNARTSGSGEEGIRFMVSGRLLTLSHFDFAPKRARAVNPEIEIIKGHRKNATPQMGKNGKFYEPFVMRTGAKTKDKVQLNVFVNSGARQQSNKDKWAIKSYRTVSVPQMLGNPEVTEEVQRNLLKVFDQKLFRRIETRTGVMQQNIAKG